MFGSGIEVYQGTFLWLQKQQKTPKAKNYPTFEVLGYPFYDKISTTRVPQRLLPALAGYARLKAQASKALRYSCPPPPHKQATTSAAVAAYSRQCVALLL